MNFPSKTLTSKARQSDAALLTEGVDRLLDEHLSQPPDLVAPSSGFVHSVMESIYVQASASRFIFPWHHLFGCAVALACALVAFDVFTVHARASLKQTLEFALHSHMSLAPYFTSQEVMLFRIDIATFLSIAIIATSFWITGNDECR